MSANLHYRYALVILKINVFKVLIRFYQITKPGSEPLLLETNLARPQCLAASTEVSVIFLPASSWAILLKVCDVCQTAYCGCKYISADTESIAQSNWRQRLWRCYRRSSAQRLGLLQSDTSEYDSCIQIIDEIRYESVMKHRLELVVCLINLPY